MVVGDADGKRVAFRVALARRRDDDAADRAGRRVEVGDGRRAASGSAKDREVDMSVSVPLREEGGVSSQSRIKES